MVHNRGMHLGARGNQPLSRMCSQKMSNINCKSPRCGPSFASSCPPRHNPAISQFRMSPCNPACLHANIIAVRNLWHFDRLKSVNALTLQAGATKDETKEGFREWGVLWTDVSTHSRHPLTKLARRACCVGQVCDVMPKTRAVSRMQVIKMERAAKRRRGPPPLQDMAVHVRGRRSKSSHPDECVRAVRRQSKRHGHTRRVARARRRAQLREQRGRPAAQGRRGAAPPAQQLHIRFSGVLCAALCQARVVAERRAMVGRGVLEHQKILGHGRVPRDHESPSPSPVSLTIQLLRVSPLSESVQNEGNAAPPHL